MTAREEGRVVSTQVKEFVKPDRTLDYDKGYQEVLRRAEGCSNFNCSKERFISLCNEDGNPGPKGMREAITGLQLEAQGEIFNLRRVPESGSDFIAEDIQGVTIKVEIKGPVGSAIKAADGDDPSVLRQGKSIGKKHIKQMDNWTRNGKIESPKQVVTVIDMYDVPVGEKPEMQVAIKAGIKEGVQNYGSLMPKKIIFMNHIRNR